MYRLSENGQAFQPPEHNPLLIDSSRQKYSRQKIKTRNTDNPMYTRNIWNFLLIVTKFSFLENKNCQYLRIGSFIFEIIFGELNDNKVELINRIIDYICEHMLDALDFVEYYFRRMNTALDFSEN